MKKKILLLLPLCFALGACTVFSPGQNNNHNNNSVNPDPKPNPDPVNPDPIVPDPVDPDILEEPPEGEYQEDDYLYYSIEKRSDIYKSIEESWGDGCGYPSIIEIQHSKNHNGTLLCAYSIANSGLIHGNPTWLSIARSLNQGDTWSDIAKVYETIDPTLEACWNPCLIELPEKVGHYDAGTIVMAGISIDAGQERKAMLNIWVSTDVGETWHEISTVVSTDFQHGIWEPHLIYEDGYLYCFFADDRGDAIKTHDQTIAYNRTNDLLSWGETVGVVFGQNLTSRPGMPVVTKMGNGEYFLVYEYGIDGAFNGVPIYFKTSKFIDKWGKYDDGSLLLSTNESRGGSAPFCIWFPKGGECGTLIVTCKYGTNKDNKIFVSHDYGKTFNLLDNFLPYSNRGNLGYHPSYCFSKDGKYLYCANTTDLNEEKGKIEFCRIRVYNKPQTKVEE